MSKAADMYTAGLFDGEGCVKLCRQNTKRGGLYQPAAAVVNTAIELLNFLRNEYGGTVASNGRRKSVKHKQTWRWECRSRVAVAFLTRILPYMRELAKIRRAKIAISFCDTKLADKAKLVDEFYAGSDRRRLPTRSTSRAKYTPTY